MVFFHFQVIDTMNYGGLQQNMGTIVVSRDDLYWANSYYTIRSSQKHIKREFKNSF